MPSAVPVRAVLVVTFPLREQEASAGVFRPCAGGAAWEPCAHGAYSDMSRDLAEQLRSSGPRMVLQARPEELSRVLEGGPLTEVAACFDGAPVRLQLSSARLQITDVGFGAVTLDYAVDQGPALAPGPEMIDLSLTSALILHVDDVVAQLACDLRVPDDPLTAVRAGAAMWGHLLHAVDEWAEWDLDRLAPVADEVGARVALRGGSAAIRPGLGSTVALGCTPSEVDVVVEVLGLVSTYYAAMAQVDRRVFGELVRVRDGGAADDGSASPYASLYEEVSVFRAVLETLDLHLAASTALRVRLWGAVATTWRMSRQLEALTAKLEILRSFEARRAEDRALAHSDRLAFIAVVFTVLSFVGTLLAVIDFGQGPPLVSPDDVRVAVVTGLTASMVLLCVAYGLRRRR